MNPLKLKLPAPGKPDPTQHIPTAGEIAAWLKTLKLDDTHDSYPQVLGLLQRYNRLLLPASQRFQAMRLLQPAVLTLLQPLQEQIRNRPLPLSEKRQTTAEQVRLLLEEMDFAFKLVVNDAICLPDETTGHLSHNDFLLALRQAIVQLGLLLLEHFAMYAPAPPGLWGELHRLYHFAERNGLHNMALESDSGQALPLTTIEHAYLRVVLLALAHPNHLGPGQAELVYGYLDRGTAGCRLLIRRDTEARAGDIMVDLAGDGAPSMAAGYARFRPVEGRFLDIERLQQRLREARAQADADAQQQADETPRQPLAERMRRELLDDMARAWAGHGDRIDERLPKHQAEVLVCIGLGAVHHFVDGEQDFNPEHDEIHFHLPHAHDDGGLKLMSKAEAETLHSQDSLSFDSTRLSRFEAEVDVWGVLHDTEVRARALRESAMVDFVLEPWQISDISTHGARLRRHPDNRVPLRVGALLAYRDPEPDSVWHIGEIRWLHNALHYTSYPRDQRALDIGVSKLCDHASAVAVRAIAGHGSGGEYFRSLLIGADDARFGERVLVVPANIYDSGTQLVLNLKTTIKYVQLNRLVATSSAFSLFAFSDIEQPREERRKIAAMELNAAL